MTARTRTAAGAPRAALVGLVAALAVAAGLPAPPGGAVAPRQPLWGSGDPADTTMSVLTRDGGDAYAVLGGPEGLRVMADSGNRETNTRVVVTRPRSPEVVDGESCASWGDRRGDIVQLGAALRATDDGGRVQAITVTQNIWVNPYTFNVHTWDTARDGLPQELVGQIDMRDRFFADGPVPYPWSFCARAVGDRVEFKVWSRSEQEPPWGDVSHSDGVTLPAAWVRSGRVGWYVGHLRAGDHVALDSATTWAYRWTQSMVPRGGHA